MRKVMVGVKKGKIWENQGDFNFSNWMKRESGGTVTNNVHSYVYINFEPLSGGEMVSKLLSPEPFDPREESQFTLASLGLKDDCYKININQTHYDATSQNILATATTFVGLFFDIIFGYMPGQDKNACIAAITGSIITDVSTTVLNAANLTAWDLVDKTGTTVWNGLKAGANQPNCLNFITPQKIMLALGQQSAVMLQVVKGINIASKSLDILGYIYPFVDPIEINEIFQLYDGKLKEACVMAVGDETLKEEYGPGDIVYPGIEIKAQSQYAEWVKSGFKVKWVVALNNGTVNLPTSETNGEGKATVAWTLPDNMSGEVTLKAEILDKEGDHLTGSPVIFTTKVKPGLIGSWSLVTFHDGYSPGQFQEEYHDDCPSIPMGKFSTIYDNWTFTENTFSRSYKFHNIYYNKYISECSVISDNPNTEEVDVGTMSGTYTIEGNSIKITNGEDSLTMPFKLLNNGNLELTDSRLGSNTYARE